MPLWYAFVNNEIWCEATIIPEYSIPVGPLGNHPPLSYISSIDFTQLLAIFGVAKDQT